MKRIGEILASIAIMIGLLLIYDSMVCVHPIDSSQWQGIHNHLGQWIGFEHLRLAEFITGLALLGSLATIWIVCLIKRLRSRRSEQPETRK
mgnify:CR=1 FL=1